MLKVILIIMGAVMINYLPLWAAEQCEQINGESKKLKLKVEEY